MVDVTEAMESQYLTKGMVESSSSKMCVIVDSGKYEDTNYGKRLSLRVNIDGKLKTWRPNIQSVKNLSVWGNDSVKWLAKPIALFVEEVNGKDVVIARPGDGTVTGKDPEA